MRLTVDLPWFTYPRRLAMMLFAMLLLLAIALPTSAAPPTTTADVTVVNDETNPVPVTVQNTSLQVSGSVDVNGLSSDAQDN